MRRLSLETKKKISEALTGYERSESHKRNISISKLGAKNGMWKEKSGYQATHTWLRAHYKKPPTCAYCGLYKKLDWASKTKEYKKDISEYVALCRSCHIKYDRYGSISL